MRALVVDDFEDMRDLLDFVLTSDMGLTTVLVSSGNEAIEILQGDTNFDLIISDLNMPDGTGADLYRFCQKAGLHIPFVLLSGDTPEEHPEIAMAPALNWLHKPFVVPTLVEKLTQILKVDTAPTDRYVPVALGLLQRMQKIETPLFVRINDQKYVKITDQPIAFTDEEFQKYTSRGLRYLYIESTQADHFISSYRKKVLSMNAWHSAATHDHEMISLNVELLKNVSGQLGWDSELVELARQAIHRALTLVRTNQGLHSVISKLRKIERFGFADHCTLTLLVSTGLLQSMGYQDEISLAKLAFTSVLHDMSLSDVQYEQKAKLIKKIQNGDIHSHDTQLVFDHPLKAAAICAEWSFCPPGVDQMILNHHERPDGSGFPNKATAGELDFLSSLFIVAEDFTDYFIASFGKINAAAYLNSRRPVFNRGHFKSIFRALETAVQLDESQVS